MTEAGGEAPRMTDHAHTYIPHQVAGHQVDSRAAWYLSVCDVDRPGPEQFLGVFITTEPELRVASDLAWRAAGSGAHIEIVALPYPQDDLGVVGDADQGRLLSKADLARIGENVSTVGELGGW